MTREDFTSTNAMEAGHQLPETVTTHATADTHKQTNTRTACNGLMHAKSTPPSIQCIVSVGGFGDAVRLVVTLRVATPPSMTTTLGDTPLADRAAPTIASATSSGAVRPPQMQQNDGHRRYFKTKWTPNTE